MAAPAYEYIATGPISIGGALGYNVGDLVPASVVDEHDLHAQVQPVDEIREGSQAPADSRVDDDAADDLPPNAGKD